MANVGGAKKGNGHLEYGNVVVMSADRNGSTAFMENLKGSLNLNGDYEIYLGECFSQDPEKNQPTSWWDPSAVTPRQTIDFINRGTGKRVMLKLQITWPNFDNSYFDINAERRIFFHRNLFDSTLSRCVALKTGKWFTGHDEEYNDDSTIKIPEDFFILKLEYRIEQYLKYLEQIRKWCNECYRYESYNYKDDLIIKPNLDKTRLVDNYYKLKYIYHSYPEVAEIERILNEMTQ